MKQYHYCLIFGSAGGRANIYQIVRGDTPLTELQIANVQPMGYHLIACTFLGMSAPTPGGTIS